MKSWEELKLNSLPHEDAKKVLISHVNCDVRKTEHFSYLDIIVELLISIILTYREQNSVKWQMSKGEIFFISPLELVHKVLTPKMKKKGGYRLCFGENGSGKMP